MGCCLSTLNLRRLKKKRQNYKKEPVSLTLFPPSYRLQNQDGTPVSGLETIDFETEPDLWDIPSNKLKFY